LAANIRIMGKENLIKRKLKIDFQKYGFKAIPQGFSSTNLQNQTIVFHSPAIAKINPF
jgi:hypothetical protein